MPDFEPESYCARARAYPVTLEPDATRMELDALATAETLIGHRFASPALLSDALMHASLADHRLNSNERMEFLGDAVLGLIVCEYLYRTYPTLLEGDLTKIKSSAVSRRSCARIARETQMDTLLRLGKGMSNREALPDSIAAAAFESVTAAIFLDAGMEAARVFVLRHLVPVIEKTAASGHQFNFKSVLQQWVQQHCDESAVYVLVSHSGPDHAKSFEVCVEMGQRRFAPACAGSKKQGEQNAALNALIELGAARRDDHGQVHLLAPPAGENSAPPTGPEPSADAPPSLDDRPARQSA